jgi:predicted transcriptional regulator
VKRKLYIFKNNIYYTFTEEKNKMTRIKTREVYIREEKGTFSLFGSKANSEGEYDFDGISSLKKILSNEKAKILDSIKHKKPKSIYQLAKILNRPFKAVFDDVKLLERFGFIEMILEKEGKRVRHRPEIVVDQITIHVKI